MSAARATTQIPTRTARSTPSLRTAAAAAASLLLLAFALGACGKRITEVDAGYVFPEGRVSPDAQLVVWSEAPVVVRDYADATEPPGPVMSPFCPNTVTGTAGDVLTDVEAYDFSPTGSVHLTILDHTAANGFRPMRREANGGYRTLLDFTLAANHKWLEHQWELYTFTDTRPSGFTPPTYIARGSVGGLVSASSPLTNESQLRITAPDSIKYTGLCLPCDSLFTLRWDPVPGAARYWMHVYQVAGSATPTEVLRSSRSSPINDVRSIDLLLAYVGDTVTSYRLHDFTRDDVVRIVERTPNFGQIYRVRIAAVDSLGQLIAVTRGDYGALARGENYGLVRLNAYLVQPKRPSGSPPFCQPESGPAASFAGGARGPARR